MPLPQQPHRNGDPVLNILNNSSGVTLEPGDILSLPLTEEELDKQRIVLGLQAWEKWSEAFIPPADRRGVRSGIYAKGRASKLSETESQLVAVVVKKTLEILETVRDGHFPMHGMVSLGFVRELWIDLTSGSFKNTVWCRLTTDACPMGKKMMDEAQSKLLSALSPLEMQVEINHGGREYNIMNDAPPLIRQIIKAAAANG